MVRYDLENLKKGTMLDGLLWTAPAYYPLSIKQHTT